MNKKTREEILRAGKVDIKVKRSGTLQFQEFAVKRVQSAFGTYAFLEIDKFVDLSELLEVAEELQLPIKAKNGFVFPKGKTSKDFVGL
ncbi:hypothetical protein HY992_00200 [Candidatus Micrarchaeota archaeon]|nr:hypothetical protein [Candidatus Micrarchaeota archaeon]